MAYVNNLLYYCQQNASRVGLFRTILILIILVNPSGDLFPTSDFPKGADTIGRHLGCKLTFLPAHPNLFGKEVQMQSVGDKKTFLALWLACLVGSWSVLPYLYHFEMLPSTVPLFQMAWIITLQSAVTFAIACWLSYWLLPKTDLSPFGTDNFVKRILLPGAVAGLLAGLTVYIFDRTLFQSSVFSGTQPPAWMAMLASVYGAVNEEVSLRLFLFTLVYFLIGKVFRKSDANRQIFLWTTNVLVALAFGLGHLPAAMTLITPSGFEIFRILLLNAIPGLVFGWLYWSRGLWCAMVAHFAADLMIHAL